MRAFFRGLRVVSAITLFFFCWTYMPIYAAVAYAAQPRMRNTGRAGRVGVKDGNLVASVQRPEERFQKALEEIRKNAGRAEEKTAKNQNASTEIAAIKTRQADIQTIDTELRKEFSATEKKLKAARLPKEILDRHYRFVSHYNDNINQLKAEIADVEKAEGKDDKALTRKALAAVKEHIEKTRAPRKTIPLDPNNLPFRARKVRVSKARKPRLNKKDFEKDFPQQKQKGIKTAFLPQSAQRSQRTAWNPQDFLSADPRLNLSRTSLRRSAQIISVASIYSRTPNSKLSASPILVASNGSLAGLLLSDSKPEMPALSSSVPSVGSVANDVAFSDLTQNSELNTQNYQLAASTLEPPISDDLSETPDVQFTDAIRAKARELEYSPVKIYEWVRSNIEYAPTYGSIQGADQCLQSKICNDMDTASLLIALLRVSGIYAHYVYGTIEVPIDKVMNWVGGVTNPQTAGTILATNGIPATLLKTSSGVYKVVQMEHVWVNAFIDYIPSRGAVQRQGNMWIPLDASFKQYEYNRGMDLYAATGINGEKYLLDYITDTSTLTISDELLTGSFSTYTISPYQYYSKRLFNYLNVNFPSATYQDVFGADTIETSKQIIKQEYPYLIGTLPYRVTTQGAQYAVIPDSLRHKANFLIEGTASSDESLFYTISLPETAGKRITLFYAPATSADESLVAQYGTLLNVPPYLINVKPVLKINGIAVATGSPIGLGQEQVFNMTFNLPIIGTEIVSNTVIAGDYSAIVVLFNKEPVDTVADKMETLINNIGSSDLDDLLGQMLYNVGISYFHHLNFEEELYAKNFQMIVVKGLSEAMITSHAVTDSLFGVPYSISEGGVGIDVDKNEYMPFPIDGSQDRERDFMIVSGLGSSIWENMILQSFFDIPSVSAISLLKSASQQSAPIYEIDSTNINTLITGLQVGSEVIDDVKNAVNAGKKVFISQTNVQYNDWNGVGYIVLDPSIGAAAYMISGGLAGGGTSARPNVSLRDRASYIDKIIGTMKRAILTLFAYAEVGTIYRLGSKDPKTGYIDCSGLVAYAYEQVGVNDLGTIKAPKNAQMQYDYVNSINGITSNPQIGDIAFFQATYDKNGDGVVNNDDGVTHVGIYFTNNKYIAAQGSRNVDIYLLVGDPTNGNWGQNHFFAYGAVIP